MANKVRDEVDLVLGGTPFTLRLTFNALQLIEQEIGMSVTDVLRQLVQNRVKVSDLAVIVWICANEVLDKKSKLDLGWVGSKIMDDGIAESQKAAGALLMRVLQGPKTEAPQEESGAEGLTVEKDDNQKTVTTQ